MLMQGIILLELQLWAKELGYNKCILETGNKMIEAIGLYKKNDFQIFTKLVVSQTDASQTDCYFAMRCAISRRFEQVLKSRK